MLLSLVPLITMISALYLRRQVRLIFIVFTGFIMTMIYPLYVNWRDYRELTFSTVDNIFVRELYNGVVVGNIRAFRDTFPVESQRMWWEFHSESYPGRTAAERQLLNKKYLALTWDLIRRDTVGYINMRFEKMWFVWQKESIYVYWEPDFEVYSIFTYLGNLGFLIIAGIGLYSWQTDRKESVAQWLKQTIVLTIVIATVGYSLANAEQRYTVPLYPMVAIGAAFGIKVTIESLKLRLAANNKKK